MWRSGLIFLMDALHPLLPQAQGTVPNTVYQMCSPALPGVRLVVLLSAVTSFLNIPPGLCQEACPQLGVSESCLFTAEFSNPGLIRFRSRVLN